VDQLRELAGSHVPLRPNVLDSRRPALLEKSWQDPKLIQTARLARHFLALPCARAMQPALAAALLLQPKAAS